MRCFTKFYIFLDGRGICRIRVKVVLEIDYHED